MRSIDEKWRGSGWPGWNEIDKSFKVVMKALEGVKEVMIDA